MSGAEKKSALIAAVLVAVCLLASFISVPQGFSAQKSAERTAIMTGGDDDESEELLPGDTVNINTATAEELCLIPGVGDTIAQRIIDWRAENGSFASIDEFVDAIDGIGENNIEDMRMYLTLEDDAP